MARTITIASVITGIQVTRVGSHPDIQLVVENDDSIGHIGANCVMVGHPTIENLPPHLKYRITYPRSRDPRSDRVNNQYAFMVSGEKVGNVPATLCGIFRQMQAEKLINGVKWY